MITTDDVRAALGRVAARALDDVPARANHALHVLAHVEAELFGYDPGCETWVRDGACTLAGADSECVATWAPADTPTVARPALRTPRGGVAR